MENSRNSHRYFRLVAETFALGGQNTLQGEYLRADIPAAGGAARRRLEGHDHPTLPACLMPV